MNSLDIRRKSLSVSEVVEFLGELSDIDFDTFHRFIDKSINTDKNGLVNSPYVPAIYDSENRIWKFSPLDILNSAFYYYDDFDSSYRPVLVSESEYSGYDIGKSGLYYHKRACKESIIRLDEFLIHVNRLILEDAGAMSLYLSLSVTVSERFSLYPQFKDYLNDGNEISLFLLILIMFGLDIDDVMRVTMVIDSEDFNVSKVIIKP